MARQAILVYVSRKPWMQAQAHAWAPMAEWAAPLGLSAHLRPPAPLQPAAPRRSPGMPAPPPLPRAASDPAPAARSPQHPQHDGAPPPRPAPARLVPWQQSRALSSYGGQHQAVSGIRIYHGSTCPGQGQGPTQARSHTAALQHWRLWSAAGPSVGGSRWFDVDQTDESVSCCVGVPGAGWQQQPRFPVSAPRQIWSAPLPAHRPG